MSGTTIFTNQGANFDTLSPTTTKGDVIARTTTTNARVAVGVDGQVLTADTASTPGVKWSTPATVYTSAIDTLNYTLTGTVAASALTITLKTSTGGTPSSSDPVKISFRNATAATGDFTVVSATAATSLVISSGSTLGHISAVAEFIHVYAINNAGTIELACTTNKFIDTESVVSTTAEGGAGAADSRSVIYSTTARTNVGARYIGRIGITEGTAGTWATGPTEISLNQRPFDRVSNPNASLMKFATANITQSAGTYSITSQDGSWIGSLTKNGTGDVSLNLTTGFFTSNPIAFVTSQSASQFASIVSSSTTVINFKNFNDGGTATESNVFIVAFGVA